MHELGVVFRIVDIVKDVANENKMAHVDNVTLELGEVSGVIEEYLQKCWKWTVNKEDLIKGASLTVETIPALSTCEDCGGNFGTVEYGKKCPICDSMNTYLIQGNEFSIKEIGGA